MSYNRISFLGGTMNKSAKYNTKLVREELKKFYKKQKGEDRKVGLAKNALFQQFHDQMRLPIDKRDIELLKSIVEQLKEIKQMKLFTADFPSFALFKKYCKREDITLKDLKEV